MVPPSDHALKTRRKLSFACTPPGTPNMVVHLSSSSSKVKVTISPLRAVAVLAAGSNTGAAGALGSDALLGVFDAGGALGSMG